MLGPAAGLLMSLLLGLYIWGSASAYLLILGESLRPVLVAVLGEGAWYTSRSAVIAGASTIFILPLCFPRTLTAIAGGRGGRGGARVLPGCPSRQRAAGGAGRAAPCSARWAAQAAAAGD